MTVPRLLRAAATRLLGAAMLLAVVSVALFAAVDVLPGDAASQALAGSGSPEEVAALRRELGYDRPAVHRYLDWVGGVLRGDAGTSAVTRTPVGPLLSDRAQASLVLGGAALAAIAVLGVGAGLLAGSRPGGRRDRVISAVAMTVTSVPEFAIAALLVAVFAFGLGWLPPVSLLPAAGGPLRHPEVLVLPAATLALYGGAYAARLIRAVVADVAVSPHVESARVAGLPEWTVLRRHVLPSVRGPVAQVLALLVPYVVGGALVVETVFGYPGLGNMLAGAVQARDAVQVEAAGMVLATAAVVGFVLAELVRSGADPHTDPRIAHAALDTGPGRP